MKKNLVLIFFLAFSLKIHAQDFATNPPDFSKMTYEEASAVVNDEERKRICPPYISNLVAEIRSGHLSHDNMAPAIYLLGVVRPTDTNAIETLIHFIDFKASRPELLLGPPRWGKYPAVDALIKVGNPAVEPILNHLPQESSELRRQLMCIVLKAVLRNSLASIK